MKCKVKTMKVLLQYGLFGHQKVVQPLHILFLILFQHSTSHHGLATTGYFHEELSLTWEDLELQHLSTVNGPSLHSNGYHVINATFPAKQTSYIVHISKSEGLFHPEHLGISPKDASNLECLYSGTVSETRDGAYTKKGIVSLSTCHHKFGFEGLLLLPHEQYYIRPTIADHHHHHQNNLFSVVKRSTSTPTKPLIAHKAYKINSPNGPFSKDQQNVDGIMRVPPEELLKATQNQTNDLDGLDDEGSSNTGNDNDDNTIPENSLIGGDDNCGDDLNCKSSLPPVMAALSKGKQRKNKKTQKTPQKKSSTSSKSKVVEIAVFTDEKLYKTWQARYPKDTTAKMNQYVLAVINNMNALYKQPSMTEEINFRLVHLEIETSKPKSLKDHNGHATKYLKAFCGYAAEKNQNGRLWDHALLLTGFDLQEGGSTSTAGIAWFSTMCINGLSCSVIEGSTFGSTFITSHEIGHSLGMEHDGEGPNTGCDANGYLMSPTTGGGKTDWSKCSMKNLRDFLSKGYQTNAAPTCITKKGSKAGNPIKFSNNLAPGQQFPASEQCSAECSGCYPYTTTAAPYNNMCHLLFCAKKNGMYITIQSTHPALEGTTCSKGKKCRLGKCV